MLKYCAMYITLHVNQYMEKDLGTYQPSDGRIRYTNERKI